MDAEKGQYYNPKRHTTQPSARAKHVASLRNTRKRGLNKQRAAAAASAAAPPAAAPPPAAKGNIGEVNENDNGNEPSNILKTTATKLLLNLTGTVKADIFFFDNPKATVRKLFEQLDPPDQCNNVIGKYAISKNGGVQAAEGVSVEEINNCETLLKNVIATSISPFERLLSPLQNATLSAELTKFAVSQHLQEYYEENTCWLCGELLYAPPAYGLSPECEHILPVIQAAYFLELFGTYHANIKNTLKKALTVLKNVKKLTPASIPKILDALTSYNNLIPEFRKSLRILLKEYAWAHAGCNRIKSNKCFLFTDKSRNAVAIDYVLIKAYLKDIFMDSTHTEIIPVQETLLHVPEKYEKTLAGFEAFYNARIGFISKKLEDICEIINGCNINIPGCKPDFQKICAVGAINLLSEKTIGEKYAQHFKKIEEQLKLTNTSQIYLKFNTDVMSYIKGYIYNIFPQTHKKNLLDLEISIFLQNLYNNFAIASLFTDFILRAYVIGILRKQYEFETFVIEIAKCLYHIFLYELHGILGRRNCILSNKVNKATYTSYGIFLEFFKNTQNSYSVRKLKNSIKNYILTNKDNVRQPIPEAPVSATGQIVAVEDDGAAVTQLAATTTTLNEIIVNEKSEIIEEPLTLEEYEAIAALLQLPQIAEAERDAILGLLRLPYLPAKSYTRNLLVDANVNIVAAETKLNTDNVVGAIADYCISSTLLDEATEKSNISIEPIKLADITAKRAAVTAAAPDALINVSPFIYKLMEELPDYVVIDPVTNTIIEGALITINQSGIFEPPLGKILGINNQEQINENMFDCIDPYDIYSPDIVGAAEILIRMREDSLRRLQEQKEQQKQRLIRREEERKARGKKKKYLKMTRKEPGSSLTAIDLANKIYQLLNPGDGGKVTLETHALKYLKSFSAEAIRRIKEELSVYEIYALDAHRNRRIIGGNRYSKKRPIKCRLKHHIKTRKHRKIRK